MMFLRGVKSAMVAVFAFFCSAFVTESFLNSSIASAASHDVESAEVSMVKTMWPELLTIVESGANAAKLTDFIKKYMDLDAIAKSFCNGTSTKFNEAFIDFLICRFKGEALTQVKGYSLDERMNVVNKGNRVEVHLRLVKDGVDPVNGVAIFKNGKLVELMVLNIPVVESARTVTKKYCETEKIQFRAIKDVQKRVDVYRDALSAFCNQNSKGK